MSAAHAFTKARSAAMARLRKAWPKFSSEHEDIVADCWLDFDRAWREGGMGSPSAWLAEAADRRAASRNRKTARRERLAEGQERVIEARSIGSGPGRDVDHARAPTRRAKRVRGFVRGPAGFLYPDGTEITNDGSGETRVLGTKPATRTIAEPLIPITDAQRHAAAAVFMLIWPFDDGMTHATGGSSERLGRLYWGAFGHTIADAEWVALARRLDAAIQYAKRSPSETPEAVRVMLGETALWVTDRLLREMLKESVLGRGGGRSGGKTIRAVVRAAINAERRGRKSPLPAMSSETLFGP
jgi:hypothetical protein